MLAEISLTNICGQRIILNCICYFNQFWEETDLGGYFGDKNILQKSLTQLDPQNGH